jgi:hypothetical protein
VGAGAAAATDFEAGAGLTMEIDRGPGSLLLGKKAVCTIKVANQGSAEATNLGLSVTVPEGLKVVGSKGPGAEARQEGPTLRFAALPKLAAGAEATFTVEAEAVRKGPARLRAELSADQAGGPLQSEAALTVLEDETPPDK